MLHRIESVLLDQDTENEADNAQKYATGFVCLRHPTFTERTAEIPPPIDSSTINGELDQTSWRSRYDKDPWDVDYESRLFLSSPKANSNLIKFAEIKKARILMTNQNDKVTSYNAGFNHRGQRFSTFECLRPKISGIEHRFIQNAEESVEWLNSLEKDNADLFNIHIPFLDEEDNNSSISIRYKKQPSLCSQFYERIDFYHLASFSSTTNSRKVKKYTSRYDIIIKPDDVITYQISRRVIGPKGCNMKKINASTGAKLRLRGIGSGYYEGVARKEAKEPLHLCISAPTNKAFVVTCEMVENLLTQVGKYYTSVCPY